MNVKKALILASVASMIDQFNMENIKLLQELGYQVEVAANFENGNTISNSRIEELKKRLVAMDVKYHHIPIPRNVFDIKGILSSLELVRKICNDNKYNLLHCHSPIGSVVARIGASSVRKKGTRIIYTAHGFHFYKGAPKKNWLIYYPIEKFCARWTDVLITINKEDYVFAKQKLNIKRIEYVPGIGVDIEKFSIEGFDKNTKKEELGISRDSIVLLSVGELNENKNQKVIIQALGKINNSDIHYVIAGQGNKYDELRILAKKQGVNLHLLGYRTDVCELYNMADVFVFPSFREGLSVSLMEAMASGLPCVVSEIRGNVDLIDQNGGYLCEPSDYESFSIAIRNIINNNKRENMGMHNRKVMEDFSLEKIDVLMRKIYK